MQLIKNTNNLGYNGEIITPEVMFWKAALYGLKKASEVVWNDTYM